LRPIRNCADGNFKDVRPTQLWETQASENVICFVETFQSVMAGLDPATHRAGVCERWSLFGAQTRAGWMAA